MLQHTEEREQEQDLMVSIAHKCMGKKCKFYLEWVPTTEEERKEAEIEADYEAMLRRSMGDKEYEAMEAFNAQQAYDAYGDIGDPEGCAHCKETDGYLGESITYCAAMGETLYTTQQTWVFKPW